MTGESLHEDSEEEIDEDYLDPRYLHTAAELYDNPELYYEMQSQLETSHGGDGYQVEIGRNFDIDEDVDYSATSAYSRREPGFDEAVGQTLSPRQYSMLMNSMQEPLSMYTTTDSRQSVMEGLEQDYDALEMYSRGMYEMTSPKYDTMPVEDDYSDHPAFAGHDYSSVAPISRPPTRYGF